MSNVGKVSLVRVILPAAVCLAILTACAPPETAPELKEGKMKITSPAFQEGAAIPSRYSCDGEDISPALSWSGAPEGTRYFALVMDDPDAPGGTFTHWVIFNIPADSQGLAEAVAPPPPPNHTILPSGIIVMGIDSWVARFVNVIRKDFGILHNLSVPRPTFLKPITQGITLPQHSFTPSS